MVRLISTLTTGDANARVLIWAASWDGSTDSPPRRLILTDATGRGGKWEAAEQ